MGLTLKEVQQAGAGRDDRQMAAEHVPKHLERSRYVIL
jgi:hypothetical protein